VSVIKVTVDAAVSGDGIEVLTGEPIVWRYTVSNDGRPLAGVTVTDSQAGVTRSTSR